MFEGSILTFLVEIICFKAILLCSWWRSYDVRLYFNVHGRDQML